MLNDEARGVVEAIADYIEVSKDLREKLDNYDGYSPSYAFSHTINQRAESEKRLTDALEGFVVNVILSRYAVTLKSEAPTNG